ncbi:Bax inhibitor-1/YccA family protein [Ammoniphilus sp. 3BR4]|uniref:Bax inhibitor-1/YccA family protein n=1 Tax=Ammoniphilus sp. 3BR4 TaxID=3158265 RepID=UPI00346651C5
MRSGNPVLKESTFASYKYQKIGQVMTLAGTVNKTLIALILLIAAAGLTWKMYFEGGDVGPWLLTGTIGGFLVALITIFKPSFSPVTVPIYAILEGLFIGALSARYEAAFGGITMQAVSLTFGTLFVLLLAYKSRMINVTHNFRLGVVAATGAIALVYLANIILSFWGMSVPFLHENGWMGIGISIFIVIIAALNLVLDFDFIEKGSYYGSPKYMEWYGAFGLIVTLVWLYLEILRLLAKFRSRD